METVGVALQSVIKHFGNHEQDEKFKVYSRILLCIIGCIWLTALHMIHVSHRSTNGC